MTSGDHFDVLVAMNPASLKANLKMARKGATIILNTDAFADEKALEKAGYTTHPFEDNSLNSFNVIKAPVQTLVREATADLGLDPKSVDKTRNMFALGILLFIFNKTLDSTNEYIQAKFGKKPLMAEANKRALEAGYIYADNMEALESTFHVDAAPLPKGKYRNVIGNVATAWGLIAAAERSGLPCSWVPTPSPRPPTFSLSCLSTALLG
jgi:2-oxoglutarate ferredoxin oxidoreductase subunit alpha